MLAEFQKILYNDKNQQIGLKDIQDLILYKLQQIFPHNQDFSELNNIFLGQQLTPQLRLYKLVKYFSKLITQNLISKEFYSILEKQAQKLQLTIRTHIKMGNQMKIYTEHLEAKTNQFKYNQKQEQMDKLELEHLRQRQKNLLKEISQLKKNFEFLYIQLQKARGSGLTTYTHKQQNRNQSNQINWENNQQTDKNIFFHKKSITQIGITEDQNNINLRKDKIQNPQIKNKMSNRSANICRKIQRVKILSKEKEKTLMQERKNYNQRVNGEYSERVNQDIYRKKTFNNISKYQNKTYQ